ncbi:MAG: hypothetical protein HYU44_10855, partial [Betaproteobacteria bacterium]|nr:hypothetical protein [Betaproteobacteria bacterium]
REAFDAGAYADALEGLLFYKGQVPSDDPTLPETSFLIAECFVAFLEQGRQVARQLEIKDGNIALPEAPGLGVEIDEAALAKYPYRQFDKRAFRTYRDEGP